MGCFELPFRTPIPLFVLVPLLLVVSLAQNFEVRRIVKLVWRASMTGFDMVNWRLPSMFSSSVAQSATPFSTATFLASHDWPTQHFRRRLSKTTLTQAFLAHPTVTFSDCRGDNRGPVVVVTSFRRRDPPRVGTTLDRSLQLAVFWGDCHYSTLSITDNSISPTITITGTSAYSVPRKISSH